MPLPMRWVMSSPIHISKAVPVVRVRTTTKTVQALNSGRGHLPNTAVEQERRAGRLHHGDRDRQAGPLGDLALTDRSCCCLLDLGNHHAKDLHDDRCRDVRHDASANTENWVSAPPEELNEAQDAALVGLVAKQLDRFDIDPRGRDDAKSIDRNDHQREQDLAAQIARTCSELVAAWGSPERRSAEADRNRPRGTRRGSSVGVLVVAAVRRATPERLRQDFNRAAGAGDRRLADFEGVGLR